MTDMLAPEVDLQQSYEVVAIDALQMHPTTRDAATSTRSASRSTRTASTALSSCSARRCYVLAGNHRLQAARAQSIARVPVIFVDVDDDAARRILLVDNRTNDLAEYDDAHSSTCCVFSKATCPARATATTSLSCCC
jgi:hypothetical protein